MTVHRSIVNTKAGDNAELACDYETPMDSEVSWRFESKILPAASSTDSRSKYTQLPSQLDKDKSRSLLVISKVEQRDLGDYECIVKNAMGESNVAIELTYVPEQPRLNHTEQEAGSLISHWHIRSLEPLTEVILDYKLKDVSEVHILVCVRRTRVQRNIVIFIVIVQCTVDQLEIGHANRAQRAEQGARRCMEVCIRDRSNVRIAHLKPTD